MKPIILLFLLFVIPLENVYAHLSVTDQDKQVETIDLEQYTLPYFDNLFIDQGKLENFITKLDEKLYKSPVDAKLNRKGEIIQEKQGVQVDKHAFAILLHQYLYERNQLELEIPKRIIFPRVDSELLSEIREKKIGSYVTYFKKDNIERTHNIALATTAINNYVVFPGKAFSFNKIVGERTKEKGYKRAPVIVKGEIAEDIGGGICQVSSTLFNAVNLRGIQIVERFSHSRSVPYVPPGKDATVSWWGPDFVFENKYSHPILIRATSDDGKMKIDIFTSLMAKYEVDDK